MSGDRTPKPYLQTAANEVQGQLSPNGRWMAYASNESKRLEVTVQSFPDGPVKWPISTGGGSIPTGVTTARNSSISGRIAI